MKDTVNVNLGGTAFVIDEDAYVLLKNYLNDIESRLGEEEREIMTDIETRISEIFNNMLTSRNQVVNIAMTKRAMSIIGRAEEFGERKKNYFEETKQMGENKVKRFFRSRSNRVIGGVCGGMADYFSIDPTLLRVIAFILIFLGGVSVWVYIIMWIAIPEEPIQSNIFENKSYKNRRR